MSLCCDLSHEIDISMSMHSDHIIDVSPCSAMSLNIDASMSMHSDTFQCTVTNVIDMSLHSHVSLCIDVVNVQCAVTC